MNTILPNSDFGHMGPLLVRSLLGVAANKISNFMLLLN